MLRNYLKIAFRNLFKHKAFSSINVVGLAIGLACFVLVMLYVIDELSYDRHHSNSDNIYRVALEIQASEGVQRTAQSPPIWPTLLMADYPEVVNAVRFKPPRQKWMVNYGEKHFSEKRWAFADSSVFEVFDLPLMQGDAKTALNKPFTVVLSEAMANKYFHGEDPVGKIMTLDNQFYFHVTAIMQNMPRNSHFNFDFLASFVSLEDPKQLYLVNALQTHFPFAYTYLQLKDGYSAGQLEAKFPAFTDRHVPAQFRQAGPSIKVSLQPLTDIHLRSHLENEIETNGDLGTIYIFFAVAVFILLIACINFMNLATARSANRAKEVGLRKVVGAVPRHIVGQFLGESVLLAMLALAVALLLVGLGLPLFNSLTGKAISMLHLARPPIMLGLIGVTLVVGVLSGSYPAFFLSAFRPAAMLRGKLRSGTSGQTLLRKGLIIFQFSISVILIISTGIVYNQIQFVRNQKLGLQKEQVLVIQLTDPTPSSRYRAYKNAVLRNPNVVSVSASLSVPAGLVGQGMVRPATASPNDSWQVQTYFTDYDFIETMGMELVAGRAFSRQFPTDTLSTVLINETAARAFGWSDPATAVEKELQWIGRSNPIRIIGVVRDFHSQSAHERIAPTVIGWTSFHFFALVRISPENIPATIAFLQETWSQIVPGYLFDYSFLDDDFDRLYRAEDVLVRLLGNFALLTVFIACLGLFGLASFTAEQRTKEIGVRKVLGASVMGIVVLLSREFTKLVVIAFILAAPVAYFAMNLWLDDFAYRIELGLGTFVAAGLVSLAIAWLTVSYQSIKAALNDPVDSLRYE